MALVLNIIFDFFFFFFFFFLTLSQLKSYLGACYLGAFHLGMYPVSSLSYGMFWFISHQKTLFPEAKYFRRFAQSSTTFTI